MKLLPGIFSMQINVPHSVYGYGRHMMPDALIDWLREMLNKQEGEFVNYHFVGFTTSGNGFTDMVTNQESIYMVYDLKEEDGLAFKIQFPKCRVHICQQYEH